MSKPQTAALIGVIVSVIALVTTAFNAGAVQSGLSNAYTYPNAEGLGLGEAASMTMTYLFTLGTLALVVGGIYLFIRPLSQSRFGWWLGATLATLGLALAVYNSMQGEFPTVIKIVFFLPVLAGIAWLAMPRAGRAAGLREA